MTAEDRMERAWRVILYCLTALLLAGVSMLVYSAVARAHDYEDPEIHAWLSKVKQPDTGISCCGPSDAYYCDEGAKGSQVTCTINDFRDDKKLHRVHVPNGTVIDIPQHKINKDPNPTGRAVVWLSRDRFVWCFVGISGS
jgi:hypothetical protein